MGIPIVIATNGYGTPITEAANGYGTPVEIATNGYGVPVVIVASGGLPVVGSGGGGAYSAEATAIFAAFTTPPTTGRKDLIEAAVVALKTAGIWTKLDALYVFAAADSQAAKINWIAPGTYNCTEVNAPAFSADFGFTGASTKYLDTSFNPTTAPSPKVVQDSAALFGWVTATGGPVVVGGSVAGVGEGLVYLLANTFYGYLFDGGTDTKAVADHLGFFTLTRRASTTKEFYRNAVSLGTAATTSIAPSNQSFSLLRRGTEYSSLQIAVGGFGSQLSAAEITALYNALRTYLTGVGVP